MQDYPLILDTTQSGIQQTVTGLYCGDAGEKRLSISLLHQSCIYTPQVGTLALCGKKADGTRFLHPCTVSGSQVYYIPTAQTLAVPGTVECQLIVYGQNGSVLYAPRFAIEVAEPMQPQEGLVSADEWTLLPIHVLASLSETAEGLLLMRDSPVGSIASCDTFDDLPEGYPGQTAYVCTADTTHPLGFYRFDTQWTYLPASAHDHMHENKSALDLLHMENNFLCCGNQAIGQVLVYTQLTDVPSNCPEGIIIYIIRENSLYRKSGGSWYRMFNGTKEHSHENGTTLDKFSEQNGALTFNGEPVGQSIPDEDSLVPLSLNTTYAALQIRADWADVPVYVTGANEVVARLSSDDTSESGFAVSEIRLSYLQDFSTGMPCPVLRVSAGGRVYENYSVLFHDREQDRAAGWYEVTDDYHYLGTDAPTLSAMRFDKLILSSTEVYTDLTSLPDKAKCALDTLSRMVNVSADAMGTLGVIEDGVQRLQNVMIANRAQHLETSSNLTLSLPAVPAWTDEDLQMVLYLDCGADIDVTFPVGTEFIGGTPNTKAGSHKLIFILYRDASVWSVGGIDTEAAE